MPTYYISKSCYPSAGGCIDKGSTNYCPSSTLFLGTLADKLMDMVTSLKQQFDDLEANCNKGTHKAAGAILAEISVQGHIDTKWEYIYYIRIYGPPIDGVFDPVYLDKIRQDIANGLLTSIV